MDLYPFGARFLEEVRPMKPPFALSILCVLPALACCAARAADKPVQQPINLLFLMTDQQRFDAMSCAGNGVIKTPNLDRLAAGGVRFAKAYTCCPVCVPARTTILTGHSPESNKVLSNQDLDRTDVPHLPTFDQVLLRNGYHGEYHGKWHSPYQFALDYSRPVRWSTGRKQPPGSKADKSHSMAFLEYVAAHVAERPLQPGELLAGSYGRPYRPDPLDAAYGQTHNKVTKGESFGCLDIPPEYTHTAYTAKEGIEALERLKDSPFTLTISISPPHPPMVLPRPYYGMYPPTSMPMPASIADPLDYSPYHARGLHLDPAYREKNKLCYMISDYYGLVTEVDDWVGRILRRLDELGLADHTLVVFTSDHGEMLGDHGMYSKGLFYEGSVHVPLLLRLPGVVPAGGVIQTPVSHIDLLATILDYCHMVAPPSEGRSLRALIDGKEDGRQRFVVSEWEGTAVPAFMVFDGRWKLLFGRSPEARSLDALYDLKSDTLEMQNLLGASGDWQSHRGEAERLKGLLVDWLARMKSPSAESVKARPIAQQDDPVKTKIGRRRTKP